MGEFNLASPPTEEEVARLLGACNEAGEQTMSNIVRRLAFQRDALKVALESGAVAALVAAAEKFADAMRRDGWPNLVLLIEALHLTDAALAAFRGRQ